jgi:hypothetical protein
MNSPPKQRRSPGRANAEGSTNKYRNRIALDWHPVFVAAEAAATPAARLLIFPYYRTYNFSKEKSAGK